MFGRPAMPRKGLLEVPIELLLDILRYLDFRDLVLCRAVSYKAVRGLTARAKSDHFVFVPDM